MYINKYTYLSEVFISEFYTSITFQTTLVHCIDSGFSTCY